MIFHLLYVGQRWFLFAGVTNIQIGATNEDILNKKIHTVMQQLIIWFHVNGLVINFKKTVAILFLALQNEGVLKPQIIFQGMDIKYKYETKLLGFHLL